jgi:hypothetical protein
MALNNYRLYAPSQVIAADNRDPYVSWQNHLARTSGLRGGVDIVAPIGTPVYARTSGVMLHVPNDGTAGNSCRFQHDANPGWRDVFSHLSRYVGVSGQHFNAGEVVAYTGISGGVDPHLHWHLVDPSGARRNPWDYFSGSALASGPGIPIIIPEEEEMQSHVLVTRDDKPLFAVVGRGSGVCYVPTNEHARIGAEKIIAAFQSDSKTHVTVVLTGQQWDAGTLDCFK